MSSNITVNFLKEGKYFVAYSPALELSAYGETLEKAKKSFTETLGIFLDHLTQAGTLEDELLSLGWERNSKQTLTPPVIVSSQTIKIPEYVA